MFGGYTILYMRFKTELVETKQRILIVDKKISHITTLLKQKFSFYDAEIFISTKIPPFITHFDLCFFVDTICSFQLFSSGKKLIFIFIDIQPRIKSFISHIKSSPHTNYKIIIVKGDNEFAKQNLDSILWFSLSQTNERVLTLREPFDKKVTQKIQVHSVHHEPYVMKITRILFLKKTIVFSLMSIFLLWHLAFIPPLCIGSYYNYRSFQSLKVTQFQTTRTFLSQGSRFVRLTKKLYALSRPTYLVLSLALIPDNIIEINERVTSTIQEILTAKSNGDEVLKLFLKKDKSPEEKDIFDLRIKTMQNSISKSHEDINILIQKIPNTFSFTQKLKKELSKFMELTVKLNKINPSLEVLFAKNTEKKYLILFANNMELSPGGGVVPSFGVLDIKDRTIQNMIVYDTSEADEKLTAHIEPPAPLKIYRGTPHWLMKDTTFSGDFLENYAQAKFFLDKELQFADFDGCFLITTTAMQNILRVMGNIDIPDLHEVIHKDNLYIKTQMYETEGKKDFYASLIRAMIIQMERTSSLDIVTALIKSLDEKQLVAYFDDAPIQKLIDSFYWSGRIVESTCPYGVANCANDYVFFIDTNVGNNKANLFVSHFLESNVTINSKGIITHTISLLYKNDSQYDVFPGGIYKNYFHIMLPKNSVIKKVLKNNTIVDEYEVKNDTFTHIEFYFEVLPKTSSTINIAYELPFSLQRGKGVYQLLIQKQTGAPNHDIALQINLPKNVYLLNQNFSSLVKNNTILYNTSLSADKIFFTELIKE